MPMRLSGLITGMDTEALVGQLMSAQSLKKKKTSGAKQKLEWKQDAWKELNKKLTTFYNGTVSKMRMSAAYSVKKAKVSDETKATIDAGTNAVTGNYTMEIKSIASAQFLTSGKTSITSTKQNLSEIGLGENETANALLGKTITFKSEGKDAVTLTVTENTKVDDFLKAASDAGINANYDTTQKKFFFSSKETGVSNAFSIDDGGDGKTLNVLGLGNVSYVEDPEKNDGSLKYTTTGAPTDMALKGASDSHIILNGADLTSSSSTVSANGLNINLTDVTAEGKSINFSVSNDIDAAYNNIKNALKEYNDLMKEMNEKYNAASSKGYEPLTSEEKRALSDDEVEEWEKKIKDSLFRRDTKLEGIMSGMRSAMMMTTQVNGKNYSLSSFGITTSTNYREGGLLHIFGDEDDSEFSGQEDKLKKALSENPEDTIAALTNIFEGLRSDLFNRMKATEYSSGLTFYDDKQMDKDLEQYKKDLKAWDDKMAAMEEAYYKKFAAMESAMAKMQSQQSQLSGMLGLS